MKGLMPICFEAQSATLSTESQHSWTLRWPATLGLATNVGAKADQQSRNGLTGVASSAIILEPNLPCCPRWCLLFVVMLNCMTINGIRNLTQMADEHGKRDVGRNVTALGPALWLATGPQCLTEN